MGDRVSYSGEQNSSGGRNRMPDVRCLMKEKQFGLVPSAIFKDFSILDGKPVGIPRFKGLFEHLPRLSVLAAM